MYKVKHKEPKWGQEGVKGTQSTQELRESSKWSSLSMGFQKKKW
jgi:hypothetical protein